MDKIVQVERHEGYVILTLTRPQALNALNRDLLAELEEALNWVEQQSDVRALILTGAGEKAFVAGADIKELREVATASQAERLAKRGQRLFTRLEELPIPVIMAVNGFALGGGCELAMSGDVILASEQAKFGQPEVNLGVIPGYGGTQRLARRIGNGRAKLLCFTGEIITAEQALQIGLVEKVVPHTDLLDEAKKLAHMLAQKAPLALNYIKQAVNQGTESDLHSGLLLEASYFGLSFDSNDRMEGMDAFIEKRKPQFRGE
ncbi:enoyl-CoA hydratase/isomerase family protein [Mechercharimyces sp. CAU 1602]|uniref:enoyl-CoA hydratase/isomerase family protein n=1 Tax=Mechercharimyces sp. CAU 1602 TaxID=2973933 RepID=UPI002162C00B|nr:enoyl-CoA hydratase-related protein [Mechercharimyces sp. CAU 1602]MCS1352226.1 enoyl-CoA hydratase-related protein [Mechercharimyces sp. CAU 1602]